MDNHQMINTDSEFILYFSTLTLYFLTEKATYLINLKKKGYFPDKQINIQNESI